MSGSGGDSGGGGGREGRGGGGAGAGVPGLTPEAIAALMPLLAGGMPAPAPALAPGVGGDHGEWLEVRPLDAPGDNHTDPLALPSSEQNLDVASPSRLLKPPLRCGRR